MPARTPPDAPVPAGPRRRRVRRLALLLLATLAGTELVLQLARPAPLDAIRRRTFHVDSGDADYITMQPLNYDARTGLPLLVFDPELFWRMLPDRQGAWFLTEDVRTNAFGLRGPPLPAARREGELRLLVLGDSITFGFRVAERERWSERLAEQIAEQFERDAPARNVVLVNAGVVGYATSQGRAALPALLEAVRPDLVLACFGVNDCVALGASDAELAAEIRSAPERVRQGLRASQLVCALEGGWAWLRRELHAQGTGRRLPVARWLHYPGLPPRLDKVPRTSEQESLQHLAALRAACADVRAPLVLVSAYTSPSVPSERASDPALFERIARRFDAFASWASEHDVPFADARATLPDSGRSDAELLHDPFHPTPVGHELMAAEVLRALLAAGLPGARAPR
jgi:lysophospholipase L1-like esterase